MAKILIVEDDEKLVQVLRDYLLVERHVVESAQTGIAGLDLLSNHEFDLVILDLHLPELGGIELLKRYRSNGGNARVLILTGQNLPEEIEEGFDAGADDYLTKPFHIKEVASRVAALMRRKADLQGDKLKMGELVLIPRLFEAYKHGEKLKLSPREFALLEYLMRHPNEVYSADQLIDAIWSSDTDAAVDVVKSYVHRVRDKLGTDDKVPSVVTVHRVGYKLVPPI